MRRLAPLDDFDDALYDALRARNPCSGGAGVLPPDDMCDAIVRGDRAVEFGLRDFAYWWMTDQGWPALGR